MTVATKTRAKSGSKAAARAASASTRVGQAAGPSKEVVKAPVAGAPSRRATARWLRDSSTGVLAMRQASLVDSRDENRRMWERISALALDFIQNSGHLKGAVDQVLADTVGDGLKLRPAPDLKKLGYSEEESAEWIKLVKNRWRRYAENPDEVDARGKFTLDQLVDVALRHSIGFGEAVGVISFFTPEQRRPYGIQSGTKLCLTSPHRLVRDTDEFVGLHSGVIHDVNGRPIAYRFKEKQSGIEVKRDYRARDADGRTLVVHAFDPWDAEDVRGISVIASALRTQANYHQLREATVATAILQTVFAATLTSPEPSADAFEALAALEDEDLTNDFLDYFGARLDKAKESRVSLDSAAQVSHLAPGEELKLLTPGAPGPDYLPFSNDLKRETARAIGVTYSSYAMDHDGATYSSTRMEGATIWPIVLRRRKRIAAPFYQAVYESWLDEEIGEGRIPLKGGYRAFLANRHALTWAEWQGPPKPTADDKKSAEAQSERLVNGTSTLEIECAENGLDVDDVIEQRAREAEKLRAKNLPNVFERVRGGGGGSSTEPEPKAKARKK
ncbi:lambda family phage portal protein [Microvirga flocculans]|uniref:Lambda family phage portal protein n=1 Tax=Microvirga flocculans TaxID=217168 RepID=A0A7W6IIL9_9HYPH|nr:phage portal protein [Microvirga flocculans]MBB4042024.1 lambda family phage portal protein [Microvirga flocculans]